MNLNKPKLFVLLLPAMALSGCEEWKTDQTLLNGLWKKTVEITGLPTETPMPKTEFLPSYDPEKKGMLGRCYYYDSNQRLEIYLQEGINNIWKYRDGRYGYGYRDVNYKEGEALIYSTAAHEMLHYALFLQNLDGRYHHKAMQELGYLEKLVDFISQYFQINPNGLQKEIALQRLAEGISNDQKYLKNPPHLD